jgi:hypothetical protein
MRCFKDQSLVGRYAALVTWAGVDAVPWFRRQGFSEDQIVNSRYCVHSRHPIRVGPWLDLTLIKK